MKTMWRRAASTVIAVVFLFGCSAGKVSTTGPETKPYAPANVTADGDIRYLNAGAKSVRDARREDAYKKMYAHCGGPYEIVREEDEDVPLMGGPFRRIWFRCTAEKPKEP